MPWGIENIDRHTFEYQKRYASYRLLCIVYVLLPASALCKYLARTIYWYARTLRNGMNAVNDLMVLNFSSLTQRSTTKTEFISERFIWCVCTCEFCLLLYAFLFFFAAAVAALEQSSIWPNNVQ